MSRIVREQPVTGHNATLLRGEGLVIMPLETAGLAIPSQARTKGKDEMSVRNSKIVDMYKSGVPTAAIAREFGITKPRINAIVRGARLPYRNRVGVEAQRVREAAKKGRIAGLTAAQIAEATGMTRNAVIGHWFRLRQSGEIT